MIVIRKEGKSYYDSFYRKSKGNSTVTSVSKKLGTGKDLASSGTSFRTVKKLKSSGASGIEKCQSCQLFKKPSLNRSCSRSKSKGSIKSQKVSKNEENILKVKKLSEKMIPKVPNKYCYLKKSSISHFKHGWTEPSWYFLCVSPKFSCFNFIFTSQFSILLFRLKASELTDQLPLPYIRVYNAVGSERALKLLFQLSEKRESKVIILFTLTKSPDGCNKNWCNY